jgi:RNA recognition motif-containing protein
MQGVYCLSRPMRLSHATAKNKAGMASHSAGGSSIGNSSSRGGTPLNAQFGGGQHHPHDIARSISPLFPVVNPNTGLQNSRPLSYGSSQQQPQQQSTKAIPPPTRRLSPNTIEYLSELAAANGGTLPFGPGGQIAFPPLEVKVGEQEQSSYRSSGGNVPSSLHIPSSNYNSSRSLTHDINPSPRDQQYGSYGQSPLSAVSSFPNSASPYPSSYQDLHNSLSPTSLGHPSLYDPHASSMSGSGSGSGSRGGGGGVNSTDPNNTTVFVGGLSSLISEDTLKTFFTPFGEITYVRALPSSSPSFRSLSSCD